MAEAWTPTAEQRAAIAVGGSACVRAGAGSGKTAVLARRFIELLRPRDDGAPGAVAEVGQILAITFTEKAAAEMTRKIREVLAAELDGATAATRPTWLRLRRELLGAQISTIHAFCARLLRENPLEAGVDPDAGVLDEHESRAYVEAAVETALLARLRAGDRAAQEIVLRAGLAGGRTGGAVVMLADFLAWLGRTGRDGAWLVAATARQAERVPGMTAELRRAADRLTALVDATLPAGGKRLRDLAAAWPAWKARLAALGPETPLEEFVRFRALRQTLADARHAADAKDELDVAGNRLAGRLADAYGELHAFEENTRLASLVAAVADEVRVRKRDDAVLTFDDLIAEAHAMLRSHAAVRERYARRFRAILVDEFQDTDRVQADVVRILSPDTLLFVVGDEKQSIYRFRGADVAVFQAMAADVGRELPLGTNFRSVPSILSFVNALAAAILRVPPDGEAAHWTRFDAGQRLVPHRAAAEGAPAVRLVTFVEEHARRTLRAAEARELEARVLAGAVERLHVEDGIPYGEIAVLFRAFTEVKTYEGAFRRREIPYYVVRGRGFFQCQEVSDLVSLLGAVLDPDDGVALAATLRSPLFGVDDDTLARLAWPAAASRPALARYFRTSDDPALGRVRDVLARLRATASRATIAELIVEACAATDFEAVCLTQFQGAQKVANVRKLIELAREWERRRFFSLRDFVRTVRRLAASEPREPEAALAGEADDVVRLMTIHQAKGLEFSAVVLPDLGRVLRRDVRTPAIDEELGVVGGPLDAAGRVVVGHAGLTRYRARDFDRERAESARLFYVGCTRARDVLVLVEGKGDARFLKKGEGDRHIWCHQVWDVVGREAVEAFAGSADQERTLDLADGVTVRLERAGRYLAAAGVAPPLPEPRVGPSGDADRALVARVLDWTPSPSNELTTTPTALADFRRCPRQYWYRHVVGVPERGAGSARASLLGTAAHAILQTVALDGGADVDLGRLLAARPEAFALDPPTLAALADDLAVAVAALRADVAAGFAVLGSEVPFVLALPLRAPRLFLHGRIDLLGRRGGEPVVRDYKYARASATAVESFAPQLAAYRLAVRAATGGDVGAELVFLRGGTAVRTLPALDAAVEEENLVSAGGALGAALAAGKMDAFPRRPAAAAVCETLGCGYVRRCWGTRERAAHS